MTKRAVAAMDVAERTGRFAREADMLRPLRDQYMAAIQPVFKTSKGWHTFFEVPVATYGVVDVLHVRISDRVIGERERLNQFAITDWWELQTFLTLQDYGDDGADICEIANRTCLTVNGLRRGALKRLLDSGHVGQVTAGRYAVSWKYSSPVQALIAIEAKRTDWRGAIVQAGRYTAFADCVYIALESGAARRAVDQNDWLDSFGLGVLAVNPASLAVSQIRQARTLVGWQSAVHRALAFEQIVALRMANSQSGPISQVFGRILTVSKGIDPRIAN